MSFRIGALILAAGQSSRFGRNKLLEPLAGRPMVRHVAEAALTSPLDPVLVVTGNESAKVRATLADLPLGFCDNSNFSAGLSTSLKCGLKQIPPDCDGVMVLLGDMPGVDAALISRLVEAFDPQGAAAIVVPTSQGQRGNPVLWARRFFPAMLELEGDTGARSLLDRYSGLVREVEACNDAPLRDIDTVDELAAHRQRPGK